MTPPDVTSVARREWAAVLTRLLSPAPPAEASRHLATLLPALSGHPEPAFTTASAIAVAQARRYAPLPGLDVIDTALSAWWRDNRPYPIALPAPREPDVQPPTPEAHEHVRRVADAFRAETRARQVAAAAAAPPARRQVRPLTSEQLRAAYEEQARTGSREARQAAVARLACADLA